MEDTKIDNVLTGWFIVFVMVVSFAVGGILGYSFVEGTTQTVSKTNEIPDIIFVRGHRWNVAQGLTVISGPDGKPETVDAVLDELGEKEKFYGITDCPENVILIHSDLSRANERDDLMHELLHAGTCDGATGKIDNFYYNSTDQQQHEGIYKISQYITELFHENPELVKYFISE